jgi:hypothetical protein
MVHGYIVFQIWRLFPFEANFQIWVSRAGVNYNQCRYRGCGLCSKAVLWVNTCAGVKRNRVCDLVCHCKSSVICPSVHVHCCCGLIISVRCSDRAHGVSILNGLKNSRSKGVNIIVITAWCLGYCASISLLRSINSVSL